MQPLSEAPPLPLFVLGPLADPLFVERLLERRVVAEAAVLVDHAAGALPGAGPSVVVPQAGAEVEGRLLRHLNPEDLHRLDAYSGIGEGLYVRGRAEARPETGTQGEPVFVYLPTDRALRSAR